ncbi:MAG: hypothetical protein EU541_06660 [Promethearchaeota archaeon]|nr:MAG: hypothetical protein EU541_06660 [Candidatus Lokiarchaeota archaeon]
MLDGSSDKKKDPRDYQFNIEKFSSNKYDLSELKLEDIIDVPRFQSILDNFHELINVAMAIIDMEGKILVATGWQDICTKFHRAYPKTEKRCIESDIYLTQDVEQGEFLMYKCKNNMIDIATPIIVGNKRIGTLFFGQFLFEEENIDYDFFIKQAEKFRFDKEEYLSALERVPRLNKEKIDTVMSFYTEFAVMISELSYKNILLKNLVKEQRENQERLRNSEEKLKKSVKQAEFYRDLLAHDIANKLSNVYSSVQLMDMFKNLDNNIDKVEDLIRTIKEEVQEGKNIISNVRKLSKVEDKGVEIKPINLKNVLQSTIKHAEVRAQRRKLKIAKAFPDKDIFVKGGDFLIDAFENILINGAIHNESETIKIWIEISVIRKNQIEKVKIEFKDNGVGIPNNKKKTLFQKAYQKSSKSGGMGIGLSLVKTIIDSYDGKIWVENRVKGDYTQGSNFIVLLNKK